VIANRGKFDGACRPVDDLSLFLVRDGESVIGVDLNGDHFILQVATPSSDVERSLILLQCRPLSRRSVDHWPSPFFLSAMPRPALAWIHCRRNETQIHSRRSESLSAFSDDRSAVWPAGLPPEFDRL
jgi:hypothetical protein